MLQPDPGPIRFNDRAAFHAWVERQSRGRWERHDGVVVAMAPERLDHTRIKAQAWLALRNAIRASGAPCEAFVDGPMVEVGEGRDFGPDAVVNCGERGAAGDLAVRNPVIVVEVTSPSTGHIDGDTKLDGYFSLPSVQHYLRVSTTARQVIHHSRLEPGRLLTRIHKQGTIDLDPPGLAIEVTDLYDGTELA